MVKRIFNVLMKFQHVFGFLVENFNQKLSDMVMGKKKAGNSNKTTLTLVETAGLLIFGLALSIPGQAQGKIEARDSPDYKIIGYVAGWKENWTTDKIDARKLTHINYAFAVIEDGRVVARHGTDPYNFKVLDSLKQENPDLKLLISVGGWADSHKFSDAALTEKSRTLFAESAIEFMKKYNLDGVDIDWEYPASSGQNNMYRAVDKQNFTLMLKKLREQLDIRSEIDGRTDDNPYLLTVATGASQGFLNNTEMHKAHQYLDFVNVMTYDFHTGGNPVAGHHTNLYPSGSINWTGRSSDQAIQWYIDAGIPPYKLVLGVAFYGRFWSNVRPNGHGLYEWTPEGDRGGFDFHEIKTNYENKKGFTRYWDDHAKAPYLWNPDTRTFITYDDQESLTHKTYYIKARGLGGVMFWEYSSDTTGVLLNTLYEGLKD